METIRIPVPKIRNTQVKLALARPGGPMSDRRAPRGGAKNCINDYLSEYEEDQNEQFAIEDDYHNAAWRL
jgi:hypothetical protein